MEENFYTNNDGKTIKYEDIDRDLLIIASITGLVFILLIVFQGRLMSFIKDANVGIMYRTIVAAGLQFGIAGLGIAMVMIYRKESFQDYNLIKSNTLRSVGLSFILFLPYLIYILISGQFEGYSPLSVMVTKDVIQSGFPGNVIGILIIATAWGFFEGFNYVVISAKIDQRYPVNSIFFSWGALICTVMCILVHGAIGVTADKMIELACIIILIYGMLIVKNRLRNAWGIIFVFMFLWNAF